MIWIVLFLEIGSCLMAQAGLGLWLSSAGTTGLCHYPWLVLTFSSHLHRCNISLYRYLVWISVSTSKWSKAQLGWPRRTVLNAPSQLSYLFICKFCSWGGGRSRGTPHSSPINNTSLPLWLYACAEARLSAHSPQNFSLKVFRLPRERHSNKLWDTLRWPRQIDMQGAAAYTVSGYEEPR